MRGILTSPPLAVFYSSYQILTECTEVTLLCLANRDHSLGSVIGLGLYFSKGLLRQKAEATEYVKGYSALSIAELD